MESTKTPPGQYVDPEVSKVKYEQEKEHYLRVKAEYRKEGIILLDENYPNMYFGFISPKLFPKSFVFAVRINFDNYDLKPLSVTFIDPLSFEELKFNQVPTHFIRRLSKVGEDFKGQKLLQAEQDQKPFFCLPGIREYHDHVAHSGDSWLLYRGKGADGTLCFILEKLQEYGIASIAGYQFLLNLQTPHLQLYLDHNLVPE